MPSLRGSLETDGARSIHDLLTTSTLEDARGGDRSLPAPARETIDALSPVRHLADIRAEVHLMHDTDDHHVPFVESRALASALDASGRLAAPPEFRLFDHVQPDDLDLIAAAPELVKLLLHVRALMEEAL